MKPQDRVKVTANQFTGRTGIVLAARKLGYAIDSPTGFDVQLSDRVLFFAAYELEVTA